MPRWLDRVLPHFDIEGEAVERELALADWPEPDTTAVVVAEDLGSPTATCALVDGVALRVEPGDVARRHGRRTRARPRALLLTVAGARRADRRHGCASRGHLLPERAAWVRAHVGVALLRRLRTSRVAELRRAVRGGRGSS